MRPSHLVWTFSIVASSATTQNKSADGDPLELDYAALVAELEPAGPPPARARQAELMRTFLGRHGTHAAHQRVLQVRSRLGTVYLHACEFERAREMFDLVRTNAPPDAKDLHARACYGAAQALELLDDRPAAKRILQEIVATHATLRYARFAKTALARLERGDTTGAFAGQMAPEFGQDGLIDLDGQSHRLRNHRDHAVLLVFWSPALPDSIKRLHTATEAWLRGGGSRNTVLALALSASAMQTEQARKTEKISVPVLPCPDEFVHPAALAYRVDKLPTVVLIAPGGTVVGRDLPAREIERLAATLR